MPELKMGMNSVDQFVSTAKVIAKLPALILPQYKQAAEDLYEICKKILKANEALSRWLQNFRYFDFTITNSNSKFLDLVKEYKIMKTSTEFQNLKFHCSDIEIIYFGNIESGIKKWFSKETKKEEVQGIFKRLSQADGEMVKFVFDGIVKEIDYFIDVVEDLVQNNDIDYAEEQRLLFKSDTAKATEKMEEFSNDLANLVIQYARIANKAITV